MTWVYERFHQRGAERPPGIAHERSNDPEGASACAAEDRVDHERCGSLRSPLRALNSPGLPRDPVMQIKQGSA